MDCFELARGYGLRPPEYLAGKTPMNFFGSNLSDTYLQVLNLIKNKEARSYIAPPDLKKFEELISDYEKEYGSSLLPTSSVQRFWDLFNLGRQCHIINSKVDSDYIPPECKAVKIIEGRGSDWGRAMGCCLSEDPVSGKPLMLVTYGFIASYCLGFDKGIFGHHQNPEIIYEAKMEAILAGDEEEGHAIQRYVKPEWVALHRASYDENNTAVHVTNLIETEMAESNLKLLEDFNERQQRKLLSWTQRTEQAAQEPKQRS